MGDVTVKTIELSKDNSSFEIFFVIAAKFKNIVRLFRRIIRTFELLKVYSSIVNALNVGSESTIFIQT